jgi:RNA polymerase sigma-70 factor (ECF subfamily)
VLLTMDTDDDARSAQPDQSSIPSLQGADAAAFEDAFERLASKVLRFAHARVGPEAAEDVLADTFIAAWRARDRFVPEHEHSFEAWLIGIATKVVLRYRSAQARWLRMSADTFRIEQAGADHGSEETGHADERLDAQRRARRLSAAIAHIPPRERDPLLLHVLEEYSYEEIAAILEIPVGTVRSRISRGRKRLAERMGGEDHG